MHSPPPDDYPITGLCIVADPTKCPPGYELMYRSYDKNEDCDLHKDSFFRSRVTRYLCYTRVYPLEGGKLNNVLTDINIIGERDPPPEGFTILDFTLDTREKATPKRQICVKMVPRNNALDAIIELIILSRNRRPPNDYTLVGEMNSLLLCFKMGVVPSESKEINANNISPSTPSATYTSPLNYNNRKVSEQTAFSSPFSNHIQPSIKSDPMTAINGIPYTLSQHIKDMNNIDNSSTDINYRSFEDIDSEFKYAFQVEKTALLS